MSETEDVSRDAFNSAAWASFVQFAWTQDDAHKAFRGATGRPQRARTRSPLDVLIDNATGGSIDEQYMTEFVDWVTREHWGEAYAPEEWRKRKVRP